MREPKNRNVHKILLLVEDVDCAMNITPWMEVSLAKSVNFWSNPILDVFNLEGYPPSKKFDLVKNYYFCVPKQYNLKVNFYFPQ